MLLSLVGLAGSWMAQTRPCIRIIVKITTSIHTFIAITEIKTPAKPLCISSDTTYTTLRIKCLLNVRDS